MATYRANLVFEPGFSRPNVWAIAKDGSGVVVRFRVGGKEEVAALPFSEPVLREQRSGVWLSRVLKIDGAPGGVELALRGGTSTADSIVRSAMDRARKVASAKTRA